MRGTVNADASENVFRFLADLPGILFNGNHARLNLAQRPPTHEEHHGGFRL